MSEEMEKDPEKTPEQELEQNPEDNLEHNPHDNTEHNLEDNFVADSDNGHDDGFENQPNDSRYEAHEEYEDDEEWEENRGVSTWKVVLLTLLVIFMLVGGGIGGGLFYIYNSLQPVAAETVEVDVTIPKGSSSAKIGTILEDNGLIKDGRVFRYYVRFKDVGSRLQAGEYRMTPGMTMDEIIDKLIRGDVYFETFTFTVPEGLSVLQISELLSSKGLIDADVFLKEINEGEFDYDFVKQIPQTPERKYRLEGYLFPETYEMKKGATEHDIINRMLHQFNQVVTSEWKAELDKVGMTLDEAVILASIVEREVVVDEERPIVAGVFYNRIQDKWLLQSCATVQFVLGKQRDVITYADLEVDDPYNTYINEGLPPGPIASPGKASLRAVFYPEDSDYYFFVTKKDGTQTHHFSRTFEEHKRNNAKSQGSW